MQVRRRYALGAEPAATDPPARGNSQPFKGDCVARVTRRLSLWRAPIVRRVLAPELTTVQFRRELLDGDRGAALVNAVGVWFTVLLLCLHGFLVALPPVNVSQVCDVISNVFLVAMSLTIVPIFGYSIALALEQRRERKRERCGDGS